MKTTRWAAIGGALFLTATTARAEGVVLNLGLLPLQNGDSFSTTNTKTETDASRTDLAFAGLYQMTNGVLLGVKYMTTTLEIKSKVTVGSSTGEGTTTVKTSGYGLAVGYATTPVGFYGLLSYLLGPESEISSASGNTSSTTVYSGGSGLVVDVAYRFAVGSTFSFGPMLSYASLSYTKCEVDGTADTSFKEGEETSLTPLLGVWATL